MIYFHLKLTTRKFIWALFLILMSCTTEEKTSKADSFLTFEMPEYLMGNNLNLKASTLADSIWYVPLQTSSKSLITDKIEHLKYKNGYFYLMDDYAKTIFVFSDKGKFIRTISNKGEGPKEFHWCYQLAVDDNHVYILDVLKKIRKYTLEGEWVKDIILPKQAYRLLSFGNGNLAGYISDDQFAQKEESYSWLIINSEGDSLTCINTNAWREIRICLITGLPTIFPHNIHLLIKRLIMIPFIISNPILTYLKPIIQSHQENIGYKPI